MVAKTEFESWFESIYPIKINNFKKVSTGILIEGSSKKGAEEFLFRPSELSSERLIFVHNLVLHLQEKGFQNAEGYIETEDGLPFSQADGKNYILTPRHSQSGFSFESREDLSEATGLMAKMHLAGEGFTAENAAMKMEKYQLPYTVKSTLGDTPETFRKRCNELKRFRKAAARSVAAFDCAYLEIAEKYCALAEDLVAQLDASPYQEMVSDARKKGCLCHRDFTGHNTVKCTPIPLVINFEDAAIELPIYDVANLLRRRLRKCGWLPEEAYFILNEYGKIRSLSQDEIYVLKILLQFPQKLWRVVNKYYNSKRNRYEKTALSKLEEILQEQEPLFKLVQKL